MRRIPRIGRLAATPVAALLTALASALLAVTAYRGDRTAALAAVSAGLFALYQAVGTVRAALRRRAIADRWLRSASGTFVAPQHAWRAAQLTSARERRMLARTLRRLERHASDPVAPLRFAVVPRAAETHRAAVRRLAGRLERLEEPVSPAGMLRVLELVTDGTSPLYGSARGDELGEAIDETLSILEAPTRAA